MRLLKDFDEETNLCKEWRNDDPKGKAIQSDGLLFTRKAELAGAFMSIEEVYAAEKSEKKLEVGLSVVSITWVFSSLLLDFSTQ